MKATKLLLPAGVRYLMSFLGILVDRAGGTIVVEHLSSYAGKNLQLAYKLDTQNDRVTITLTSEAKHESN